MSFTIKFFAIIVICSALLLTSPAQAGFDEGKEAYKQKKWAIAILELRPLVEQEHAEAQLLMANMYFDGKGVQKNARTARDLYERSAKNGDDNAMFSLATIHVSGFGTKKDMNKGVLWFTESANRGNQTSQFTLATIFLKGIPESNITGDLTKSYKWLTLASQKDDIDRLQKASKELLKIVAEKITPEQIAKIEEDLKTWQPITGKYEGIIE